MIFVLTFLIGVFVGAMIWAMQDYIRNTRFHGGTTQIRLQSMAMIIILAEEYFNAQNAVIILKG